ncbi:MAG TPA: RsmE family RNA methyltransferase, partial [Candidatus Ratteibacteria bacterium]|nr:RsmE family RNA methyltransferase [Candidatus Ratteibacteria bacterium]
MKRIYLNRNDWLIEKDNVKIRGETYHYLKNVLRMKPNDIFAGFDGSGKEYLIEVSKMVKGIIYGKIIKAEKKFDIETPFDICLFQAVPKGKKMEQIVEGTAQLGVKKIYPVISKRVIVNIEDKKKKEKKIKRWK